MPEATPDATPASPDRPPVADSARVPVGTVIEAEVETLSGERIAIPAGGGLLHLQFRRFAGCPICNLHLRSVVGRHDEIAAAGIREVVFFHAPADDLRPYVADLPFAVVPDPDKTFYRRFGVESGARSMGPRAWGAIARGFLLVAGPMARRKRPAPKFRPHGGQLGLPADFLLAPDGRVLAAKYGDHAYDQWSVDELLALAAAARS
ncbi:peroxiredoxin-like family protein [Streptomyces specialis]|uniref:peroxiredoxin-like family protein n=1 Tax=Streptomyces specialis TaxID=498367 RepID=UPI000B0F0664|nr:peroxiredoxin-like family protein [Streptomyces specialis]